MLVYLSIVGALYISYLLYRFATFLSLYFFSTFSLDEYLTGESPYAIVTGASDGIGKGVATELYLRGFNLILHGRNVEKTQKVADEIRALRNGQGKKDVRIFIADATKSDNNFQNIVAPFKNLNVSILVNNVGGSGDVSLKRFDESPSTEIPRLINWNVQFPLHLIHGLLPQFRKRRGPCLVVNIGSFSAEVPPPRLALYASSKRFMRTLTWSLSVDERYFTPTNVRFIHMTVGQVQSNSLRMTPTLLRPSSETFGKAIVDRMNCGRLEVAPYVFHAISQWFVLSIGDTAGEWLREGIYASSDRQMDNLSSTQKRKAIDSLVSSDIKKPRLSIAFTKPFPSTSSSSQSNVGQSSTQTKEVHKFASTQTSSRKGKEKALDSYRPPPIEGLFGSRNILSSTDKSSSSKDSTKAPSSASNGSTKARLFTWSQRKTTQQEPISISSDSDEGEEQNILTKKLKPIRKSTSQMDVVDLTFGDDDDDVDEVTVIEMKKLSPSRLQKVKGQRSLEHRVKKTEKPRKSNVSFDDEKILLTETRSPTILPTPPKSENDEPESSEDTSTIKQRPRKFAFKKVLDKESDQGVFQPSLPPGADVIDLCTDDSSDELLGQPLGINGHLMSFGANTENTHDTVPSPPLPGPVNNHTLPGVKHEHDLQSETIGVDVQLKADTENTHDADTLSPSSLTDGSLGADEQLPSLGVNTLENAHDIVEFVPLPPSSSDLVDKNPAQPSLDIANFSNQISSEPLCVDAQLTANIENTLDPSSSSPGQPPFLETNTESAHAFIVPLSLSGWIDEEDHSPAPDCDEPAITNDPDITEALLDPISELEISPLLNSCEEEEVLRDVLLEDEEQEEEMVVEHPVVVLMETSPDEPPSNTEKGNDNAQHTDTFIVDEPVNPPDSEFPSGSLVKEPDFSKISTQATEPVPDYDDRLSAAIKWPAEKLPTELHDMINALPTNYLYNPQMRHVFEAMIEDNTAADEPRAPKIRIIGRKNGPVTPPWEFYYTNRIVNGEGVPRSDKNLLQGCDCIGPCDPKSKTCACVQRQMAWTGGDIKGFLYRKERLLHPHYPVFECNDACECSEECMNRVIQHGRKYPLSITLTKNKGWGVFADEKIPRGSYLGIYAGEMILEAEADERGKLYDRYGRTYLFDLDFYHLRALSKDKEAINTYTIDAFHAGNNHSCDPNCQITPTYVNEPDLHKPALTIFTSRDVQKGEELTFSYLGEPDNDEGMDEQVDNEEAGPLSHKQEAVHRRCLCGATNCRGQMF
ncbi:hypothetical protein Clacol_003840 [Clathrus columnatus]|uniref:Uncharacterized protein n=1 Tax=Clathrus columnatus TaxID=1419009 RepID=A0AAV5A4V1_9AGAM|nr:hypothetical protein Clacol_003840 [Clathrus columnatus]